MGIFDGILLCSDWDGTLHTPDGIPESNISAIKHFQENGGLFTVCSGRPLAHLKQLFTDFEPNTYTLTLNGAVIADHKSNEEIYRGYLKENAVDIMRHVMTEAPDICTAYLYLEKNGITVSVNISKASEIDAEALGDHIYKIVFVAKSVQDVPRIKMLANELDTNGYILVNSWAVGTELLSKESAKGSAVLRLKGLTGAKTLVTVGDYENDIEMFTAADISYATANASDHVKSFASKITTSASDGAIAAVISDIERNIVSAQK